jgi:hypothetical protein
MSASKKSKLPSGAELEVWVSPFEKSKALYQALLEEARGISFDPNAHIDVNLFKDLFCAGFSSKKIEICLKACFEKATYNGKRIDENTFEPMEARQDYLEACFEVAQENVAPFLKSLYAKYKITLENLKSSLA